MTSTGLIYALRCQDRVKIGYSVHPLERLEKIKTWCPFEVNLIGVRLGKIIDERQIHKDLAKHRTHNEWFMIDGAEVVEFLSTLHDFEDPIIYLEKQTRSEASKRLFGAPYLNWKHEAKISCVTFNSLKKGLAIPKMDLAIVLRDKVGIPIDDWPKL